MHELGILRQIVHIVNKVKDENHIRRIKHITLQVGESSGVVPVYMRRMFSVAVDAYPHLHKTKLNLEMVPGNGLVIKDIGY